MAFTKKTIATGGSISAVVLTAATLIASPIISELEGRTLMSYLDSGGVPTICNGIIRYPDGKPVQLGQTRTHVECDRMLEGELGKAITVVSQSVEVPLSPFQIAGLASFVYNVGPANFQRSTLLKRLNAGQFTDACNRLRDWVFVKGKDCRIKKNNCGGIVRRRERERDLCLQGDTIDVLP